MSGAQQRSGGIPSPIYIFLSWYNRFIIGLGVATPWMETRRIRAVLPEAVLGLAASFACFAVTGFQGPIRFAAGMVYSALIEVCLTRINNRAHFPQQPTPHQNRLQ